MTFSVNSIHSDNPAKCNTYNHYAKDKLMIACKVLLGEIKVRIKVSVIKSCMFKIKTRGGCVHIIVHHNF